VSTLTLAFNIKPVTADAKSGVLDDDFETYNLGNLKGQGGWDELDGYTNWKVVETRACNGLKSIYIDRYYDLTNRVYKWGEERSSGIQSAWIYFSGKIGGATIFSPVFELLVDSPSSRPYGHWVNAYGIKYNTSTSKWEFVYHNPGTWNWVVLNSFKDKCERSGSLGRYN
jgi:hypothetical protein